MPVTLKDVARCAGVSGSTVSAVFNGKSEELRICAETAQRVRDMAEKLDYRPNRMAKSLRRGKSGNIGILLPAPRENSYAGFIGAFEHELNDSACSAIYGFWDSLPSAEKAVHNVMEQQVDGLITVEPELIPAHVTLPVVAIFHSSDRFDSIDIDRVDAFRQAVTYLQSLGHVRIARVDCIPDSPLTDAMCGVLRTAGLSTEYLTSLLPVTRLPDIGQGVDRVAEWFRQQPARPTAFVMPNDAAAIALIGALTRRGIKIPEDVSVIGMDNIMVSSWVSPALTTFDFSMSGGIPALAVRRLLERMRTPDLPLSSLQLRASMLVRESSWSVHSGHSSM